MLTPTRWTLTLFFGLVISAAGSAESPPEQVSVVNLPPPNAYRIYLSDVTISHFVDGRLHIVDGQTLKYLGLIGTGFTGLVTLSPDRSEIYVATTYLARLNRGTRTDQIDVYDSQKLTLKAEIIIPPKHAQSVPYKGLIATTPDGQFILVQNATPASSVSIVERKAAKFVTEIPTPGCWGILPAQSVNNRFSTICGDGTLLTVTLKPDGTASEQQRSERLFDPDKQPVYTHAEHLADTYYFISYLGQLFSANLGGAVATVGESWSLLDADDVKKAWRPGGYQPFALPAQTGLLYVAMHPNGKEGSHKDPATEIWAFDLKTHQRVARVAGNQAIALAVSKGDAPLLFAIDPTTAGVVSYTTAPSLAPLKRMDGLGEALMSIESY